MIKTIPELKAALVNVSKALQETTFKDLYDREIDKSFLDLLNLLYVVMTRPTERLYILTNDKTTEKKDDKKGETKANWTEATPFPDAADLYHSYLTEKGDWQAEKSIYVFGKQDVKKDFKPVIHSENKPFADSDYETAHWDKLITLSQKAPTVWDVVNPERNRHWGNLVHTIMAEIVTAADVEPAVNRAISRGELAPDQKDFLIKAIREVVSHPLLGSYFSEEVQVKNESDILLADGSVLRPDRLVFANDKTIIIDYKTGAELETHKTQLQKYEAILRDMGYQNIEKYLVYLDEGEVMRA